MRFEPRLVLIRILGETMNVYAIKAVLFDFGGVIAEEGFHHGLHVIAEANGLDKESFFEKTVEIIHASGYLTGRVGEAVFWETLRRETGIRGNDTDLREIILKRFVVRDWMRTTIRQLRTKGFRLAILSDQTNWLDELETHMNIYHLFEQVFNSYHLGKSKRDETLFRDVLQVMDLAPSAALFVDDTAGHVQRARNVGLHAIHYTTKADFLERVAAYCPDIGA
jgi:HAD superfamily hydrolase (TIGR01509 family)